MSNTDQQRISPPPGVVRFHYGTALRHHKKNVRYQIESAANYIKNPPNKMPSSKGPTDEHLAAHRAGLMGAAVSAIFKHSRRYFVTKIIDDTAKYHGLDMTMTSAALVFRTAMGFTPSDDYLAKHYGTKGRTAASKTDLLSDEKSEMLIAFGESLQPVVKRLEKRMRKQLKTEKELHRIKKGKGPEAEPPSKQKEPLENPTEKQL